MKSGPYKFIIYFIVILFNNKSSFAQCVNDYCSVNYYKSTKYLRDNSYEYSKKVDIIYYEKLLKTLAEDNINLNEIFASLVKEDVDVDNNPIQNLEVEILSENQYEKGNIFFAENDVEVILKDASLKADFISYDRDKRIFKAKGNIVFNKGNQYFNSNYLEYNFKIKKGYVDNIYGVLDALTLPDDFNYEELKLKENIDIRKEDIINLPSEVQLRNSNNLQFQNKLGFDSLKFNFQKIDKWRFKSKRILLGSNKFESKLVFFTNDPFNKPQLIVKSNDLEGKIINGKSRLFSKKTSLILDDFLSIPLGSRTIQDSESISKWGFGYDTEQFDGLYFYKSPWTYRSKNDFVFKLTPYFLLQRAYNGETKIFREKNSSLYSDNTNLKIGFLDYFALRGRINNKINDWNININSIIRSLNPEKSYDSISSELTVVKNIFKKEISSEMNKDELKTNNLMGDKLTSKVNSEAKNIFEKEISSEINQDKIKTITLNEGEFVSRFNSDLGFYGFFDKPDVRSGYGTKLINYYSFSKKNFNKNYSLIFDVGEFGAKSSSGLDHLDLFRYGLTLSLQHGYKIFDFNPKEYKFDVNNIYNSELVDQGFFLNLKLASGNYFYSNGDTQNNIVLSIGPRFQYGQLKKNFFDYSNISLINEFAYKNNKSPFIFDNLNEDSRIRFAFKQQVLGPIIFGYSTYININSKSEDYGEYTNTIYSLGINRRAYSINLNFSERDDKKSYVLDFRIFNFGYKDFSNKF